MIISLGVSIDKAGGCITKRFHCKRIESNGILSIGYIYLRLAFQFFRLDCDFYHEFTQCILLLLCNWVSGFFLLTRWVKKKGREWICENEFLPPISGLNYTRDSLRYFIVSSLERLLRERERKREMEKRFFDFSNLLYLFKRSKWISIREINFFFFNFIPFEWM